VIIHPQWHGYVRLRITTPHQLLFPDMELTARARDVQRLVDMHIKSMLGPMRHVSLQWKGRFESPASLIWITER